MHCPISVLTMSLELGESQSLELGESVRVRTTYCGGKVLGYGSPPEIQGGLELWQNGIDIMMT